MIYADHIFIALTVPLLIAVLLLKGEVRRFTGFFILGLLACLLASYINSFLAAASGMSQQVVTIRLTPICEEVLKALPVFFFAAVFEPERQELFPVAIAVGLGFATLENVSLMVNQGAADFIFVLLRGLSAGVMHTVCAALLGFSLSLLSRHRLVILPGAFGLLCATSIFHGAYNLFVSAADPWRVIGYAMPIVAAMALYLVAKWREGTEEQLK